MIGDLGLVILCAYGVLTAMGSVAALRQSGDLGLSHIQAAVFGILGIGLAIVALASRGQAVGWIAALAALSLGSRIWNGRTMGNIHPSHVVLFGGFLALGTALTYIK